MPILSFGDKTYTVNHAVKGPDYIHGYNADGTLLIAFNGVSSFSGFSYDGTYMDPTECATESCNGAILLGGELKTKDGRKVAAAQVGAFSTNDTIPLDKGGTGATDAATARENLGITPTNIGAAESSHNHAASNITSGTLGVARGGTGKATHTSNAVLTGNGTSAVKNVATASGALYATAANGAPVFGTLPIAQGGTGSTTAAKAVTALGIKDYVTAQGTSGDWYYRKWNSGRAECWQRNGANATTSGTSGQNINFPFTFTSYPFVSAQGGDPNGTAGIVNVKSLYASTTAIHVNFTASASTYFDFYLYASGTWK